MTDWTAKYTSTASSLKAPAKKVETKPKAKPAAKKKAAPKVAVKPAAKKDAPKPKRAPRKSAADRDAEDLLEIREANEEKRLRQFGPAEVHVEVPAGDKDKFVAVDAVGGVVYVNSHGEAKLDRAQALHLLQTLQAAFQAVN